MFRLRLLGGAAIESTAGAVGGRAAQPRRLALLALLARSNEVPVSRDKLIAYLWPESTTERARHLLSESLYQLRAVLGELGVIGSGQDLRLNPEVVSSDVAELEKALGEGRPERAIGLYQGPFLDGFHLRDSREFEDWLQREREALLEKAIAAVRQLTERAMAAGDLAGAVRWARQVLALSRSETAARRLISALQEAGDRSGALRAYSELVDELAYEYGVAPSSATEELMESVRSEAVDFRPEWPLAPTRIAVLPFSIRGDPDLGFLSEGMVDLLATSFDGVGGLRAVDPHALLATTSRQSGSVWDPERAREIAKRFGATLYVIGSVIGSGGRLRLTASLHDTEDRLPHAARTSIDGELSRLFEIVDALAAQVIAELGAGTGLRLVQVAALTTHSLTALKAYLAGERAWRLGSTAAACEACELAVAEDPSFALAHYRLAIIRATYERDQDLAWRSLSRALQHAGRLSERDRLLIEGLRATLHGRANEAERLYGRILELFPEDVEAWWGLVVVWTFNNPIRGRSLDEAVQGCERILELDPSNNAVRVNLAYLRARRRDYSLVKVLSAAQLNSVFTLHMRAVLAFDRGDEEEQAGILAEFERCPEKIVCEGVRFTCVLNGDLPQAVGLARVLHSPGRSTAARATGHVLAGCIMAAMGLHESAFAELTAAGSYDPSIALSYEALLRLLPFLPPDRAELEAVQRRLHEWNTEESASQSGAAFPLNVHEGFEMHLRLYLLGLASAWLGDDEAAENCARELVHMDAVPTTTLSLDLACAVRAESLWRQRRPTEALRALENAPMEAWNEPLVHSAFHSRARERYRRASLLENASRDEEALRWYASLEEYSAHDYVYVAPSLFRRGALHERMDQPDEAADCYARGIEMWKDCDPRLRAMVESARERLAQLRSQTQRAAS